MSIRTRKLANGKSVYDVTVKHGGKREYVTAYSLAEARAIEVELKSRHCRNTSRRPLTLEQYIYAEYWPIASKRLAATSLDTYEQEIRLRIVPALGNVKLRDINRSKIQKLMIDECQTECVARKAIGTLKTILNEALNDGYIATNYACSKFAMPAPGDKRDNGVVLSSFDEIYKLLRLLDGEGSKTAQRIAYTGLLQGLRPEERYALDWSCFDLERKTVTITEARVAASSRHGGVQDKAPKTEKSTRVLPMHIRLYYYCMAQNEPHEGPFIANGAGGRISPSTAQKRWRAFLREHPECPQVTIENMRHSFATAYLAAGGRIEVLSRVLGHTNISTTINRYYRPGIDVMANDFDSVVRSHELYR